MSLRMLWIMVRARYGLLVLTLLVTLVSTAIVTDMLPRQYVATTSLVLNSSENNPFDVPGAAGKAFSTFLATQLDIMQSRSVALKVVDALGLTEDPGAQIAFSEAGGEEKSLREWLADQLLLNLSVEPSRDSRVVAISYHSTDPRVAADTANAFAQAYISTTLDMMTDPAKRNAEWFDQQLDVIRARVLKSQARLTAFQQKHGIISLDERLDTETNRLNELSRTYVQVQAEATDMRSRQLGQNHPEFRRAINREQAVARSLETQKQLLLELKQQRDQLGVLAREAESDQRVFESTLQRFYQTSLESQFNQPNTSVLNEAVPPLRPARPMVLFNMLSALLIGTALGTGMAILAEMQDRRVRDPSDVADGLGVRVLASL